MTDVNRKTSLHVINNYKSVSRNLQNDRQQCCEGSEIRNKWRSSARQAIGKPDNDVGEGIRNKWMATAEQVIENHKSWKLIDGSVEEIHWSSADDCWKWIKRFLTLGNIGVIAVCFCLLMGTTYVCFRRFFLKETTTIVRVKPTSDLNTPYVAFTVCPNFHSAYRKDTLKNVYNISVDDYRYKSNWYPTKDINPDNAKEFFHNITYGLYDVIHKLEISTMSLTTPKVQIAPKEEGSIEYATFFTQYTDTYGRCYTMVAKDAILALGITKVTIIARMGVYVFLDHPGQHLHSNSRSKVYADLGKKHYLDVHFDVSNNTVTDSEDIPCNHTMNFRYDEFLYRNLRNILESDFNCTVPFFPDDPSVNSSQIVPICQNQTIRENIYAEYDLLKRNRGNKVCEDPCSKIQTYFGLLFVDPKAYDEDKAYLKIYLQSITTIKLTVMDYDAVDMVADIGGYTGLLLGMSAIHVSKLIFKSILKVFNAPRQKKGAETIGDTML